MKTQSAKSVLALVATLFAYSAMAQDSDEELETGEREWSQLEPPTSCSCPEDCSFFGTINGEEDGIKMVLEVKWVADGDEFIRGEMHSNPSLQGMTCEYYRPFEITFREPFKEKDYEKAKKNMQKKLEKARQKS